MEDRTDPRCNGGLRCHLYANEPLYSDSRADVCRIQRIGNYAGRLLQGYQGQKDISYGAVSSSFAEEALERNSNLRVIQRHHGLYYFRFNVFWRIICQT